MPFPARGPRVSEAFADQRIREKIALFDDKPRHGLERVANDLKAAGVAPNVRLHLVSAVVDLGRVAQATLPMRLARHARLRPDEHEFPADRHFKD